MILIAIWMAMAPIPIGSLASMVLVAELMVLSVPSVEVNAIGTIFAVIPLVVVAVVAIVVASMIAIAYTN